MSECVEEEGCGESKRAREKARKRVEVRFRGDALDWGREGRGNIFRIGFCLLVDMYFRWVTLVLCIAGVKVDRVWAKLQTGEPSFPLFPVCDVSCPSIVPSHHAQTKNI